MISRTPKLAAALVAVPLLLSCDAAPTGPGGELARDLTPAERTLVEQGNAFGLDLLREVQRRETHPNVFLSPLSASMALGMTLNGAGGSTFDAMRTALAFQGMSQDEINEAYRGLLDLLTDLDPAVRFDIANSIWARQDFPFHDAFFRTAEDFFDATAQSLDFDDPGAKDIINDWVREHTNGKIEKIIDRIHPRHVMFLLNAMYFNGTWSTQFPGDETRTIDFHRADGSAVPVEAMSYGEPVTLPYTATERWQAVELGYGAGAFAMLVLVPAPGVPLDDVIASLDPVTWTALVAGLDSARIGLRLPKFRVTYDELLNDALRAMGMGIAFTSDADFTGMSPRGDELCVHFVRQKTFVQVDERGTEAAAVTAVGVGVESLPPELLVDRPFLFAIRERQTDTILFIGAIGDPTAEQAPAADDPGPVCP